jgi:hypothetical protein
LCSGDPRIGRIISDVSRDTKLGSAVRDWISSIPDHPRVLDTVPQLSSLITTLTASDSCLREQLMSVLRDYEADPAAVTVGTDQPLLVSPPVMADVWSWGTAEVQAWLRTLHLDAVGWLSARVAARRIDGQTLCRRYSSLWPHPTPILT